MQARKPKGEMNMTDKFKRALRHAVQAAAISTALGLGLGAAPALAADASDGVASTLKDATITTKVKAKLLANKTLQKSDISVSTFNGVVMLSGVAVNASAKAAAETDAKSVADVKSVDASALTVASK
jgi:osmotically-inducible protein OsmY